MRPGVGKESLYLVLFPALQQKPAYSFSDQGKYFFAIGGVTNPVAVQPGDDEAVKFSFESSLAGKKIQQH